MGVKNWRKKVCMFSLSMALVATMSGCAKGCTEKEKPDEGKSGDVQQIVDLTEGGTVFYNDLGNGIYYTNGGYIKIETKDQCTYMKEMSQATYHVVDYLQNDTRAVGYGFVAGKLGDIRYGDTEEEIIKTVEAEFGYETEEKASIKTNIGVWKVRQIPEYIETFAGEDGAVIEVESTVSIYYQLENDMLYMVYIFADEESKDAEKIFEEMTLSKTAQVIYKNEDPVKNADDETSYVIRDIRGDVYEIHVPDDIAEGEYGEEPLYSFFRTKDIFVTMHVTEDKREVKGNYEMVFADKEEKTITYDTFINEEGNTVEYEYCVVDYDGIKQTFILAQITQGDRYYILDFINHMEIEDIGAFLKGYYVK